MTANNGSNFQFGEFVLDTRQNLLLRGTEAVKLPPKAFELLLFFVKNPNQVIDKETLIGEVWSGSFVEEANLAVHISNLRKILNGNVNGNAAIETFPKIGYRFNANVVILTNGSNSSSADSNNGSLPTEIDGNSNQTVADQKLLDHAGRRHLDRRSIGFRSVALVILGAMVIGGGYLLYRSTSSTGPKTPTLERIIGTDRSASTVISPNGEFFAHAMSEDGKMSLMMTNILSKSSIRLLPPDDLKYGGMKFSRDSSFLYFVRRVAGTPVLFKIPVLGHESTEVLRNVGYNLSFSPDGDRFCFVRNLPGGLTAIVTANTDGTDERVISTKEAPHVFNETAISWSPDGKVIATAVGDKEGDGKISLIGIDVETGAEQVISDARWSFCSGIEWMNDGSGIVAGLADADGSPWQIWFVPFPVGEPSKITNDLENYVSISMTRAGDTIFAVQFRDKSNLWITPEGLPAQSKPVTDDQHHVFKWVRWTNNGRLIFGSSVGGKRDVWAMARDGSGLTQLTVDGYANVMPSTTADGRYIVFSSTRGSGKLYHLWRADPDGREPKQLTFGVEDMEPDVTPDGQTIYYTSGKRLGPSEELSIWKVSIDGDEAKKIVDGPANEPDVSPDGKFLLCWHKSNDTSEWRATIFSIDGGKPLKYLKTPPYTPVHWTADSKGVSYLVTEAGVSNVWTIPIDGGPARKETDYTTDEIFDFDWSSDGLLVSSRISRPRDVVAIRNFR